MGRWAAGIVFLLFLGGEAVGQRNSGQVNALVTTEEGDFQDQFEVSLVTDLGQVVKSLTVHAQDPFTFTDLEKNVYFVVTEVPGFKPVRRRVDFGETREANLCIILEADPIVLTKGNTSDDGRLTTVSRMAQPPALLKELAAAEKKLHAGSVDEARARLESIITQAPDFSDAHRFLGMTYQQSHRYGDAEKEYRTAQRLDPVTPFPWIDLGSIYLEQAESGASQPQFEDRLKEARDSLLQAVKLDPSSAFAHYLLGVTYYRLSFYDKAERSLTHALDLDSSLGLARLALANVYIRNEAWQQALAQLDFYIKANPHAADRGQVLAKRSQIGRITNDRAIAASN